MECEAGLGGTGWGRGRQRGVGKDEVGQRFTLCVDGLSMTETPAGMDCFRESRFVFIHVQ